MTGFSNRDMRVAGEEVRSTISPTTAIENRLRAMRETAGSTPLLTLTVQKQHPVNEVISRVLFQVGGKLTSDNLQAAVEHTFGNKVRYLAGSGHHPLPREGALVSAFVQLNAPSKPMEKILPQGWRSVTANVFSDENDKIWRAVGEGDARMLVQDTQDDLSSLLQNRNSYSVATASVEISMEEKYSTGWGVLWYNPTTEKVHAGIAVTDNLVFDFDNQAAFATVLPSEVLIVVDSPADVTKAAALDIFDNGGKNAGAGQTPLDLYDNGGQNPGTRTRTPVNILDNTQANPLTKDNMVARHLAYMAVLYNGTPYFERLKSLLMGTFKNNMAVA